MLIPTILLTGASGVGKSTMLRGALVQQGSGVVVLAPGLDEETSYYGLLDNPNYKFKGFDDPEFQPILGEFKATGIKDMTDWLKIIYNEVKDDVSQGKSPRYRILGVDTITAAVGRLSYNATLAKFKRTEPPPAQSPDGASFYGYLRLTQEGVFRLMRAIRGQGVMWIATAHPTESQVSEIQKTEADPSASKIMPDMPGGFRNSMPAAFDFHFSAGVSLEDVVEKGKRVGTKRKHYLQWMPDPKKPSKSRIPGLSESNRLPADWILVYSAIQTAAKQLTNPVV